MRIGKAYRLQLLEDRFGVFFSLILSETDLRTADERHGMNRESRMTKQFSPRVNPGRF